MKMKLRQIFVHVLTSNSACCICTGCPGRFEMSSGRIRTSRAQSISGRSRLGCKAPKHMRRASSVCCVSKLLSTPNIHGQTQVCSPSNRQGYMGFYTYGSKPGVYVGPISARPGYNGDVGVWKERPSFSMTIAACPVTHEGKPVSFSEVRFSNGALTGKCSFLPFNSELRVMGM